MRKIFIGLLLFCGVAKGQTEYTILATGATPVSGPSAATDANIGVAFTVFQDSYVVGIRFYSPHLGTGDFVFSLYSDAWWGATPLDTIHVHNTASGWIRGNFHTPIRVASGSQLVAAVYSTNDGFEGDAGYTTSAANINASGTMQAVVQSGRFTGGVGVQTPIVESDNNFLVDPIITTGNSFVPSVEAGPDKTVSLATASSTTLNGTASDINPGGGITSLTWARVSGPNTPTISQSTTIVNDTVNLVVIQGESNAAGRALNTQLTTPETATRTNTKILNNSTFAFQSLLIGTNNNLVQNLPDQTEHGLENYLANAVDAGRLSQPTYVVKCGGSGATIGEFLNGGTSLNPTQYSWAITTRRIDSAVAILNRAGIKWKITVWQSIGINDYNAGTTNTQFQTRMTQFRTDMRSRYGNNIPFLTTHFFPSHPYNAVIDAIAASDAFGISYAIDVSGATYRDPNIHWDHDGFLTIGSRMVDKMTLASKASTNTLTVGATGTALIAGTYLYRLTATNVTGATALDSAYIYVTSTSGATNTFSYTYKQGYGAGANEWHDHQASNIINILTESTTTPMTSYYGRSYFTWNSMETSQGVYNWTIFDAAFKNAITAGQRFSFSIMTFFPNEHTNAVSIGGGFAHYPAYVHNLMQGESVKDWIDGNGDWVPNMNSLNWQARQAAFILAVADHINTSSFNGKNFRDAIGEVSIGMKGAWAEWNWNTNFTNLWPAGTLPTYAADKALIDAYVTAFPNNSLVIPHAAFDGQQLNNVWTDPQTGYYALTKTNAWGKIGITRMNWGLTDGYISQWAESNPRTVSGLVFATEIMNRYKYAPTTGEVAGYNATVGGSPFFDLPRQTLFYHALSFGNGNYSGEQNISQRGRDSIRSAWRNCGFQLYVSSVTSEAIINNNAFSTISSTWINQGNTPVYEDYIPYWEFQNSSTHAVIASFRSSLANLKLFQIGTQNITDVIDARLIPAGSYDLVLKIKDPTNYRPPFILATTNTQAADGGYVMRSGVTVVNQQVVVPPPSDVIYIKAKRVQ